MRRHLFAALALVACGPPAPATGDLFLVAVGSHDLRPVTATAAVDSYYFQPCGTSDINEVLVGFRLNLLEPEPMPVPIDSYCAYGVEFPRDPFSGAIRLQAQLPDDRTFRVALDPGLATSDRELRYREDTKGILALDLDLLFEPEDIAAIVDMPDPVDIDPSHPLAETLAARVGDALVYLPSPQEAAGIYVELWPSWDFSVSASLNIEGCRGDGPMAARPAPGGSSGEHSDSGVRPTDPDRPVDSGSDSRPPRDRSQSCGGDSAGCGGCGGSGSAGCGSGGCSAGCNPDCSTLSLAPMGWIALLGFLLLRRRSR